ncbi:MAG: hypothetical protein J6Q31_07415, partial [Alistipes sp.]|nr:hypothetical protein [Alistipes sp.]
MAYFAAKLINDNENDNHLPDGYTSRSLVNVIVNVNVKNAVFIMQVSLFRGVHDTQPRPVTLEELVTMMRTDQSVRDLTEKHRYARTVGDEQGASRYKKMMASFGVAARFEGGRQQRH